MSYREQQPFYNPPIPFTGSIHAGLLEGKSITITGRVLAGTGRFHVNLQCGSRAGADIALHFNPRYDSSPGYVVTNALQQSQWGPEERKYNSPLNAGAGFSLVILVRNDSYQLNINGQHFLDFRHRLSYKMVDTIIVGGKVEVYSIAFQNPAAYCLLPSSFSLPVQSGVSSQPWFPPQPGFPIQAGFAAQPGSFAQTVIPYKNIINGGMYHGRTIIIQGQVHPNAIRFNVNLNYDFGIALHYNPRFNENSVVRNSKINAKWGSEERNGRMPFQSGQHFTLTISCEKHHYRIVANGIHEHSYQHRYSNLAQINILEIDGDLSLTSVAI